MNVFDLDAVLISRYESFARSFTNIRSIDLKTQINAIYDGDVFWPEPLISLNPRYRTGSSVADLAQEGAADPALADVFALGAPACQSRCTAIKSKHFTRQNWRRIT